MTAPVVRNRDHFGTIDQVRDYIRAEFAGPDEGMVVVDLDMVLRTYGPHQHTDAIGRLMLIEWKHGTAELSPGQRHTFRLIDEGLRSLGDRYRGFWRLNYKTDPVEFTRATLLFVDQPVTVNGHDDVCRLLSG